MHQEKDSSTFIHDRNVQVLATEMYKISKGLPPPLNSNLKKVSHYYNLRHNFQFFRPLIWISYLGP